MSRPSDATLSRREPRVTTYVIVKASSDPELLYWTGDGVDRWSLAVQDAWTTTSVGEAGEIEAAFWGARRLNVTVKPLDTP